MKKIFSAFKFVWKNNRVWLLVTSITLAIVFIATMVATQNIFLRNTISTVMGTERRVLAAGDPSKYQYFNNDNDLGIDYSGKSAKAAKKITMDAANKLNEQIVEEGIVLLKNESGALPLATSPSSKTKISVFGKNSINLVYGGSGSGGGNASKAKTLYESLAAANYDVNPALKSFYENKNQSGAGRGKNPSMGEIPAGLVIGETPRDKYTESVKSSYSEFKAAALVVISRIGGEGFDLPRTMKTSFSSTASPVSGAAKADDHYLRLDQNERDMLEDVCAAGFNKVILIVNCSTSMELGFLDDIIVKDQAGNELSGYINTKYNIDAALWLGSPGGTGVMALGRVLSGTASPSGRLVDTYARDFRNDPTWNNFSNNNKIDGNRCTLGGSGQDAYFVEYKESIYVGYRYYETRGYDEEYNIGDDLDWYDNNVVFPFGYGLSYADFEWKITDASPSDTSFLEDADGEISITVQVKNTHQTRSGKDVVQLYYSAPYYDGGIEKAHVVLGAFEKTRVLKPNETQNVTLKLKISDMASYDWNDANGNGFKGYELEDGTYSIYIAKNANYAWRESRDNDLRVRYRVSQTAYGTGFKGIIYEKDPVTGHTVENRFEDVNGHFKNQGGIAAKAPLMTRDMANLGTTLPKAPTENDRNVTIDFINSLNYSAQDEGKPWYEEKMPRQGWKPEAGETAYKLYDAIKRDSSGKFFVDYNDDTIWDNILDQLTVKEMAYLIGTGNFNTDYIESIGKPKTNDNDGPAGFTNFMGSTTVYDACFYASECVIGATWNKELARDMGVMIGLEGYWGNVKGDGRPYSGWYAPAVNIHRSPFSGRNFEYYSEDPFLSGTIGANAVAGAKSKGVYTYVKHFAVNDQETDRVSNGLITWLTEQTLREIYLKPFEIIVKEGKTTAMMSSFNRIGTVWAGGSYQLMTEVLREEWGFKGMVISDYNLYPYMPADQMIRAGGDLNLTQNRQPSTSQEALTATQISCMRQATKNILYTVAASNAMNGIGEGVVYRYAMPMWMLLLILGNVTLAVGFGTWGFFTIRKARKKSMKAKN